MFAYIFFSSLLVYRMDFSKQCNKYLSIEKWRNQNIWKHIGKHFIVAFKRLTKFPCSIGIFGVPYILIQHWQIHFVVPLEKSHENLSKIFLIHKKLTAVY